MTDTTIDLSTIFEHPTFDESALNQLRLSAFCSREAYDRFRELTAQTEQSAGPKPSGEIARKLGLCYWMQGRPEKAIEWFDKSDNSKERHYYAGLCHRALRQFDKARTEFDKAASAGWDAVDCGCEVAETHLAAGDLKAASAQVAKLASQGSNSASWHYMQGRLHEADGKVLDATACYEHALEVDDDHDRAMFHLAYQYDLHGSDERAMDLYGHCAERAPAHVNALINLAVLLEDRGRNREAESCLRRVLTVHPNHARARLFIKDVESSSQQVIDEDWERQHEHHSAILDTPISEYELSVRSRNCLKRLNINSLGDLCRVTEAELLGYKNFGETSLNEIKAMLTQKGLKLGQSITQSPGPIRSAARSRMPAATVTTTVDQGARPVSELELSVRSRKCLQRLGIDSIGDLISRSEAELLSIRNFGQTSLNEIKRRLTEMGLSLRMSS